MRDDSGWDELLVDVQAATNFGVDVDLRERGTPDEITTIRGIMFGLSGVLLIIGVANMLTTMLLNVRERVRDIGILKSIGMTPRQVVGSIASGTGLLTALATARRYSAGPDRLPRHVRCRRREHGRTPIPNSTPRRRGAGWR